MKTATVREVQHNFNKILQWIEDGEVVVITRHKRVVANMVPPGAAKSVTEWPDFNSRIKSIWKKPPRGKPASKIIIDDRSERL